VSGLVTYYCCSKLNYGGVRYCPGDVCASGHVLTDADSGRVAACGSDWEFGDTVQVGDRTLVCLDRGLLEHDQVDAYFVDCEDGAEFIEEITSGH